MLLSICAKFDLSAGESAVAGGLREGSREGCRGILRITSTRALIKTLKPSLIKQHGLRTSWLKVQKHLEAQEAAS